MATIETTNTWTDIHGRPEPPAAARALRAGDVDGLLDGIDLRYVRSGTVEAVRRIYVAVRDHNWVTIPAEVSDVAVEARDGGFAATFSSRHTRGDVDFAWDGSVTGEADGTITYRMDGRAEAEFDYNRIGICVLHPFREYRGARFRGVTPRGAVDGAWPDLIEPQRFVDGIYVSLFEAVSELGVDLPDGGRVHLAFEGDLFEAEDQRNWTDGSHKTYSTPLVLGYPHRARPGDRIAQAVRISVEAGTSAPVRRPEASIAIGAPVGRRLGSVGLGAPTHDAPLSARQAELLRALAPDH